MFSTSEFTNQKLKKILKQFTINRNSDQSNEDYKQFFEMFLICFIADRRKYTWLKEQYGVILSGIHADDWERLYRKVGMLVRELEVFTEMFTEYTKLSNWMKQRMLEKDESERELNEVIQSEKESYGFFNKVTKQQKIEELESKKKSASIDIVLAEKLQQLVT